MFTSIVSSVAQAAVGYSTSEIMLCTLASLILGIVISVIFWLQGGFSKNFRIALVILPLLVQSVIMMVDGNLGTSVAVLGAFSLVRFRSLPGNSKEICGVFFAMAVGLATAMGCIGFACLITAVVGVVMLLMSKLSFANGNERSLSITIPENLDYTTIFDDIFEKYTEKNELLRVKTTNLGSMFELKYNVTVKGEMSEKAFIDELRCKNGNLTVLCGKMETGMAEF